MGGLIEKRKISFQEDTVALHGREVQLTDEGQKIRERIEALLLETG